VDGILHRLPEGTFEESPVFQHMWSMPHGAAHHADGDDDAHPLVLPVALEDFQPFARASMVQ
jgi:hypothetical protein